MLIEREHTCPNCLTRDDEWGSWTVDPDGRRVFKPFDDPPYEARTHIDYGCKAIEDRESGPEFAKGRPAGLKVRLERPRPK